MKNFFRVVCAVSTLSLPLVAQEDNEPTIAPEAEEEVGFEEIKEMYPSALQEGKGNLGTSASIELKDGLIYLDGHDADQLMQSFGNLPSVMEGLVMDKSGSWCITFEFDPIGYVKDDEKDELDADKILNELKDSQKEANKQRTKAGLSGLHIAGWQTPPRYNDKTNNLEWGLLLKDDEGYSSLNHEIRLLGRKGVMSATLVCDPDDFSILEPKLTSALEGFEYTSGNKYSEYKKGDKIAEYGLTGLIAGGTAFVIWKFWKPIAIGVVAVGAAAKNFIGRLFGRGKSEE